MTDTSPDPITTLRETFRAKLDTFYSTLKLAPPYHSVEQAIVELTRAVHPLSREAQQALVEDQAAQWRYFTEAFVRSGLRLKHRGILMGVAKQRAASPLHHEFYPLLDAVLAPAPTAESPSS
ncbi:MAG: hypothetical protein U0172_09050 [Nitrospiraceae bacterium]